MSKDEKKEKQLFSAYQKFSVFDFDSFSPFKKENGLEEKNIRPVSEEKKKVLLFSDIPSAISSTIIAPFLTQQESALFTHLSAKYFFDKNPLWQELVQKRFPILFNRIRRQKKVNWQKVYGSTLNQLIGKNLQKEHVKLILAIHNANFISFVDYGFAPYPSLFYFDNLNKRPIDWIYQLLNSSNAKEKIVYQDMLNYLYQRCVSGRAQLLPERFQANYNLYELIIVFKKDNFLEQIPQTISPGQAHKFVLLAIDTADLNWVQTVVDRFAARLELNLMCDVSTLNQRYWLQNKKNFPEKTKFLYTRNFISALSHAYICGFFDIGNFLLARGFMLPADFADHLLEDLNAMDDEIASELFFNLWINQRIRYKSIHKLTWPQLIKMTENHPCLLHLWLMLEIKRFPVNLLDPTNEILLQILTGNHSFTRRDNPLWNSGDTEEYYPTKILVMLATFKKDPQVTLNKREITLITIAEGIFKRFQQNEVYYHAWIEEIKLRPQFTQEATPLPRFSFG